jgi:nucleotide-binding universal stress UspA family protein
VRDERPCRSGLTDATLALKAVVAKRPKDAMPSNQGGVVVVGVDGSPASLTAVKWADHYASATGVVEKARADLTLPDGRVEVHVEEGAAGPVLVSESAGAQALVVGSQGHRAVSTLLLGSVSAYCLHRAGCPVVVVR